jgi:hypothetical protein
MRSGSELIPPYIYHISKKNRARADFDIILTKTIKTSAHVAPIYIYLGIFNQLNPSKRPINLHFTESITRKNRLLQTPDMEKKLY